MHNCRTRFPCQTAISLNARQNGDSVIHWFKYKKTSGQQRLIGCWPEVCYFLFPDSPLSPRYFPVITTRRRNTLSADSNCMM